MARESVKITARGILTKYLEENHLRKTPERFAILDAIYSANTHFTIRELGIRLEENHFPVSVATLYNTINLFIKLRLVGSHKLNTTTVYEASYNKENTIRQICKVCGKMQELRAPMVVRSIEETHLHRFRMSGFALHIYGTCSTCQAKMTRLKNKTAKKNSHEQRKS